MIKKISRYIIGTIILFIIILVLALIFLPKFVPLTKIANKVADNVETQIGRTVSIEKVKFSIFSGVHLKGITLSNEKSYSTRPMITIKDITFHYDLWPLIIKKKIVVKDVGINGLNLLVEMRGKETNLSAIAKKTPKTKKKADTDKTKSKTPFKIDTSGLMDINVSKIYFTNSNITIINHNNESKEFAIDDINFVISNLNTNLRYNPASIKSSLFLLGGKSKTKISFDGRLLDFTEYELHLKIDKVAADKLLTAFIKNEKKAKKKNKNKIVKTVAEAPNFDFFKNFKINFIFNLGEFRYKNLFVTDVNATATLKDLLFLFESEAQLYDGQVKLNLEAILKQPKPNYHSTLSIIKVESATFLKDSFRIKDFVTGALSADADISSELRTPAKFNGVVNAKFMKGMLISGKVMGDVGKTALSGVAGKSFNEFFIGIKLKDGLPVINSFDIKGDGFNINIGDAAKMVESAVNDAKKEITTKAQEQIDVVKEQVVEKVNEESVKIQKDMEEKVQKELTNQLQNLLN